MTKKKFDVLSKYGGIIRLSEFDFIRVKRLRSFVGSTNKSIREKAIEKLREINKDLI